MNATMISFSGPTEGTLTLFGTPIGSKVLKNSVTADEVLWRGEQWRSASRYRALGSLAFSLTKTGTVFCVLHPQLRHKVDVVRLDFYQDHLNGM